MEGNAKVCYLIFTFILTGEFIGVRGQLINGVSSTTSTVLNGPGRILDHTTPIRTLTGALPYQIPVTYWQNSFGYPVYRASADYTPGCTCPSLCLSYRTADLPHLMRAFVRSSVSPMFANGQPFPRENVPQGEMGYFDYSGYS